MLREECLHVCDRSTNVTKLAPKRERKGDKNIFTQTVEFNNIRICFMHNTHTKTNSAYVNKDLRYQLRLITKYAESAF